MTTYASTALMLLALALASCATSSASAGKAMADSGAGQKSVELADLDRAADPCTDFHEFANGTWRAQNPIPAGKPKWSRRAISRDTNRRQVRELVEELSRKADWPAGSPEQLVGDYYAACMDEAGIEAAGLTPLAPLLAELDGARTAAEVQRLVRRLHGLGVAVPFGEVGGLDYHEPANYIANLVAGGLGLPDRDYYSKPEPRFAEAREKYQAHVTTVLKLAGMEGPQATEAAAGIFALEKRLAEASLDAAAAGDPVATDHKLSFAQLKELAPDIDWDAYFDDARLSRADLNVAEPKFIQQVDKELKETPVETWKAYLKVQLLDAASPWLSNAFAAESFDFKDKYLGGAAEQKPRGQRCFDLTEAALGEPVGRNYAGRYFPPAAKAKALAIVRSLLAVLKDQVEAVTWMTPETKKKALEKVATYNPQIGYPDKWKDYSGVAVRRDAFWASVVAVRKFGVDDNRRQVGKPTDRDLWQLVPSSPDAYIDGQLNEMVLPAGFLQPPFFSLEVNDAVNYGAFGAGVAHDLIHAIDTLGAETDVMGRPQNWWTDADRAAFQQRAQCVVDQYEGYFIEPGVHHNGKLVQGEAIGDLAGVHIAYVALEKSLQDHPVPAASGFSPEQQFFLSWGQFRGDAIGLEAQRGMVKSDIHPTAKYRVIGPLTHAPEFQKAFACKEGAAMVTAPEKRCTVW